MPAPISDHMQAILGRLQAGEQMSARAAWKSQPGSVRQSVHARLYAWRLEGVLHIARWEQHTSGGKPAPVYAFGPGKDAQRAPKLTPYEHVKRQRALLRAVREQQQRMHKIDPVLSALLGVRA